MKSKAKIDWDTVELVGDLVPTSLVPMPTTKPVKSTSWSGSRTHLPGFSDPRTKLILSGASAKARARGSAHTHAQLRKVLPTGLETFIYGWWLVTAAIESDRDVSRGVEIAAHAINATSRRVLRLLVE